MIAPDTVIAALITIRDLLKPRRPNKKNGDPAAAPKSMPVTISPPKTAGLTTGVRLQVSSVYPCFENLIDDGSRLLMSSVMGVNPTSVESIQTVAELGIVLRVIVLVSGSSRCPHPVVRVRKQTVIQDVIERIRI